MRYVYLDPIFEDTDGMMINYHSLGALSTKPAAERPTLPQQVFHHLLKTSVFSTPS
jgi:hypothetical protein